MARRNEKNILLGMMEEDCRSFITFVKYYLGNAKIVKNPQSAKKLLKKYFLKRI